MNAYFKTKVPDPDGRRFAILVNNDDREMHFSYSEQNKTIVRP